MREPLNDSSYTGPVRVAEVLAGHVDVCYQEFRLERHVFLNLRDRMVHRGWLVDSRFIRVDEQLAMFLVIVGQGLSNRQMQRRFNRSGQTISVVFHTVLQAMLNLSLETIRPPNFDVVPPEITNNLKYYPYFKDCIGAIDGTHISVIVRRSEETRYRNRKGMITQNVMCACSFDMRFTFVYAGWEGSAHDARVLDAVRTNDNLGFPHPLSGKYYFVDSGYASQLGYLVPFRGQRYHLQDYGEDIEDQSRIVVACCGIHNYIKEQAIQDQLFNELGSEQQIDDPMNPDTPAYHASASDVSQRLSARQMSIMSSTDTAMARCDYCNHLCDKYTTKNEPNRGRPFFKCPRHNEYFMWVDEFRLCDCGEGQCKIVSLGELFLQRSDLCTIGMYNFKSFCFEFAKLKGMAFLCVFRNSKSVQSPLEFIP
ncbi:uncharacterized protein LOC122078043 [Macadamia integrifolia]|uniref:uncharacterized protein LOC122078043 n=1 Tax=Macadamia integrifolia TaxID=60698 RepID=UPI001C4F09D4|nr:uncharacterized protein LOC122078043 [Macadamia integrifolia]